MPEENIPGCCNGCNMWKTHGSKCWYFWELKRDCRMHSEKQ